MKKFSVLLIVLLLGTTLMACSSRAPFESEAFKTAAQELGFTVADVDPEALAQAGVSAMVTGTLAEKGNAQVVIFADVAGAKALYANAVSNLVTGAAKVEKKVDSSTYNRLYVQNGEAFFGVVRVENTVFYGEDAGGGETKALLEKLGSK